MFQAQWNSPLRHPHQGAQHRRRLGMAVQQGLAQGWGIGAARFRGDAIKRQISLGGAGQRLPCLLGQRIAPQTQRDAAQIQPRIAIVGRQCQRLAKGCAGLGQGARGKRGAPQLEPGGLMLWRALHRASQQGLGLRHLAHFQRHLTVIEQQRRMRAGRFCDWRKQRCRAGPIALL